MRARVKHMLKLVTQMLCGQMILPNLISVWKKRENVTVHHCVTFSEREK